MLLDYENQMFLDLYNQDGLLVMAKGLGLERILMNFIRLYSDDKNLVLVLNSSPDEERYLIDELTKLNVDPLPKCITSEISVEDRVKLYDEGGVLFITSRILVVDMLTHKVPINLIAGILVCKAHTVIESGQEAFILRLFRLENKAGFIKAFSINANAFTQGYCQISRIMKNLFVRKLYLWPRFHASVKTTLERHKPEVVELQIPLTERMHSIQSAILDVVASCIKELKRCNPTLDVDELTVENILGNSFSHVVKYRLQPVWHELSSKTKQIVADLKHLSRILKGVTQYDSVSFYNMLTCLHSTNKELGRNSGWLLLDSADALFEHSKLRVFGTSGKNPSVAECITKQVEQIEISPKWKVLKDVLEEINDINAEVNDPLTSPVAGKTLIVGLDDRTCVQLKMYIEDGVKYLLNKLYCRLVVSSSNKANANGSSSKSLASTNDQSLDDPKIADILEDEYGDDREVNDSVKYQKSAKVYCEKEYNASVIRLPELSADTYKLSSLCYIQPLYGNSDQTSLLRMLWTIQPRFIILYDCDITFIRQIEVYKALHPGTALRVYFLLYEKSVEEQAYLTLLRKEKEAFEYLIKEKANLFISGDNDGTDDLVRENPNKDIYDSRDGGKTNQQLQPTIIVDMREFRSELPSLIHRRGIDINPVTLEVGDYILTPEICVERKSLSDLIGSLNSGRLYNQALAMTRYYTKPILLIEFDQNKPFNLQQGKYLLSNEISVQDVNSKLTLLTLHYPSLRILWCSSPYATAEIFEELKIGKAEPDAAIAQKFGSEMNTSNQASGGSDVITDRYNHSPQDFLLKMPGITSKNYCSVMNKCKNLLELSSLSKDKLKALLENTPAAEELDSFFHMHHSNPDTNIHTAKKGRVRKYQRGNWRKTKK